MTKETGPLPRVSIPEVGKRIHTLSLSGILPGHLKETLESSVMASEGSDQSAHFGKTDQSPSWALSLNVRFVASRANLLCTFRLSIPSNLPYMFHTGDQSCMWWCNPALNAF